MFHVRYKYVDCIIEQKIDNLKENDYLQKFIDFVEKESKTQKGKTIFA